ncbi:5'-methylthioadenosine/S-adenosylhomocysteine nucleosidase [Bacteroidia bacterium]|nr:5'-methylthioadenosine/S-adenosylhomocysteine nucleosidase [Bacteroidia bacterium]
MKTAIMSAMYEELNRITKQMNISRKTKIGNRTYYEGEFCGQEVVAVFSHWGKVAATLTATTLITKFGVEKIIFTGVAGGISPDLRIGDIVVSRNLYQHDMDSSPVFPRYEIPLLKNNHIETPETERDKVFYIIKNFINEDFSKKIPAEELERFHITKPQVIVGDIASGDEFVSETSGTRQRIINDLPTVFCVEMEGAAVAQVCHDFDIPFVVIRIISDSANDDAHIDFPRFIENIASIYSEKIVERILK